MTEKTWKTTAILLVILICLSLLYFLISGLIEYRYITLTKIRTDKPGSLNFLLKKVNQVKKFKQKILKQGILTEVLWAAYGRRRTGLRTVHSFCAHPLHLYVCVDEKDVEHLEPGLYEYKSDIHNLKMIDSNGLKKELIRDLELKGTVPVLFIITSEADVLAREPEKVYFELGGMAAHILLKTRELKLKIKIIEEFDDEKVEELMDQTEEKPLMLMMTGTSRYKL